MPPSAVTAEAVAAAAVAADAAAAARDATAAAHDELDTVAEMRVMAQHDMLEDLGFADSTAVMCVLHCAAPCPRS